MTAFNSRDGGFFLTTVGRVQTPTLAVVVEREEQIRKFVSRDYWEIHASFLAEAGEYPAKWFDPEVEEEPGRRRDQGRPRVVAARGAGHRRRGARQGRHRHRGIQAHHPGLAAAVRPDIAAARSQRPLRLLGQDHAGAGAEPVRAAQGADLSADRFARPARGLPAGGQGHHGHAGRQRHAATSRRSPSRRSTRTTSSRASASSTTAKVSDHFAIIPTLQAPSGLSDAEQRLYDLVVRRFLSVFFPSAEFMVTTRISQAVGHSFKTEGKVLVKPGWLAIWGKEAADEVADAKEGDKGQSPGAGQAGRDGARRSGRAQGPEDAAAGALLAKPRCWAPWKAPASSWKTTSCAKPCRKRAWARRPRARPSSKA